MLIYRTLWGGILLSVSLILVGLGLGALNPNALPRTPLKPAALAAALVAFSPAGFLALGVIVMILTPVARVLLSILVYAEERDRLYVLITAIVFANLLFGIVLGFA
jgi:uncharacterized membrane protein